MRGFLLFSRSRHDYSISLAARGEGHCPFYITELIKNLPAIRVAGLAGLFGGFIRLSRTNNG
jgi:hypothetical protein